MMIRLLLGTVIAVVSGMPIAHADSEFDASVTATLIHSDNIRLAPSGAEQSDEVFVLTPLFVFTQDSNRVQASISYNPQAIFYADTDDADDVFHIFDGSLTAELAPEFLFLDVEAAKFQTIVTPNGTIPLDNIAVSNNRADSTIVDVKPYIRRKFGDAELRIDVSHARAEFDDESVGVQQDLQSNQRNRAIFRLGNDSVRTGFTWSVDYRYERVEYDEAIPWEYQKAGASAGFWVSDSLRLFGAGGQETAFDDFFSGELEDSYWEFGVQLVPSPRLDFEIAAGERSFGSSVRSSLRYTTPKSTTSLTYTESPETQGALLGGRQPIRDTDNLDSLLDRVGASDRLIRKRGELSTSITLPKTRLTWRLFHERRTDQTTAAGLPVPGDKLVGAAVRLDWQLGARTDLFATLDAADRESDVTTDDFLRFGVGATYQLSPRFNLRLGLQHIEQDTDPVGAQTYDVNRVSLSVSAAL